MSKKTDLIMLFQEYKKRYGVIQTQADEVNKNVAYTETGREQAISKSLKDFAPTVKMFHDKAVEIIDTGVDALSKRWREGSIGKLQDGGYQAGLANVIKMLELGAIREQDDIQNIINNYTEDFNSLAAIRRILENSADEAIKDCAVLVPVDNREKNKNLLFQLKSNIEKYINIDAVESSLATWNVNMGLTSITMSMDSLIQFVTDRLNDDLSLL